LFADYFFAALKMGKKTCSSGKLPVAEERLKLMVPPERQGQRLDHFLAAMVPAASRSRLAALIRKGLVLVNGMPPRAAKRLKGGEEIEVTFPPPEPLAMNPEKVDFAVLHEDDAILVIAKPPGIVVHPASGHKRGTLVHGLLAHSATLSGISGVERPGIVHRLDKDTSGVMVIARTDKSHQRLVELFKTRQVKKVYRAIVCGRPAEAEGCIAKPIGRHRSNRKMMAVLRHAGREAVSRWSVLAPLADGMTYLEVRPETGRTHQIRVHMAYLGHPVAGDALYGGRQQRQTAENHGIVRQCLHAYSLAFSHPETGEPVQFVSPLWPDMAELLAKFKQRQR
jgi:23S rRNA pseudouridine1911/1915/1917 synthase